MPAVDCSYGTCRNAASHRMRMMIRNGRASGENVALWVCDHHSKEAERMAPTLKKAGLLERVKGLVNPL